MAPIISAAPHSSFFDIILILKLKNPTFVSRSENIHTPLVGNIFRLCNGIYVNRSSKNSRSAAIKAINERISNGEQVLIFPEGTCANRTALIQFKLGAFIPGLSVQPILIRFDSGGQDSISWSWEGPSLVRIFLHSMTRLSLNCEITILPEYMPNDEEKSNPKLFADNVAKIMCSELGILQSFYSYDDVPLVPIAKTMRLFRSPVCMLFLKIADKIGQKIKREQNVNDPQQVKEDQKKNEDYFFLVGEDVVEHLNSDSIETYNPKNFVKTVNGKFKWNFKNIFFKEKSTQLESPNDETEFQHLPISHTRRRLYKHNIVPMGLKKINEPLYSTFSQLIEHSITSLEQNFSYRLIESSDDIISLLKLADFVDSKETLNNLRCTRMFVDLVKMLEMSVPVPITTMHLLIVLHLCDVRETDLWERIQVVVKLFDRMHSEENTHTINKNEDKEEYLTLDQFKTFLWYSLGLNEFNDNYFLQNEFTFRYLRDNLIRLFCRAVNENAKQLIS